MNQGSAPLSGDEQLMELVREATAALDTVPDPVMEAARAAWTWRTIDAELAELAHDSTVDDDALVGVRGAGTVRALSFSAGTHFIELEVSEDGDRRQLVGQVMPAPTAGAGRALVIERVDGPALPVEVDDLGRFEAERVGAGLVRLRLEGNDGRIVTEWVDI